MALQSLETICERYRPPLVAYLLRQGKTTEDAEDLVHSFLGQFLENQYLKFADRQRGRFRTFLLTSLKNFASNEWRKAHAGKRGGNVPIKSLEALAGDKPLEGKSVFGTDCEKADLVYDRKCAAALMSRVVKELQREWETVGKLDQFRTLAPCLALEFKPGAYVEIASSLGCAPDSVAVKVLRLRRRFAQLFRQEVAATVARPEEVDEEYRYLVELLL